MLKVYSGSSQVLQANGLFLLEVETGGVSVFVAAGLEFGPDIGSTNKMFEMNALGGLVINGQGVAADIDVSVAMGGALSGSMSVGASLDALEGLTGSLDRFNIESDGSATFIISGTAPTLAGLFGDDDLPEPVPAPSLFRPVALPWPSAAPLTSPVSLREL